MKDKINTTGETLHEEDPAIFRRTIPVPVEVCLGNTAGSQEFDEIMVGRFTRISFHRTLRIPEDGRDYPLPAGLGRFPIHRVEDYAEKVPAKWLLDGGFFIPLHQKEALFLQFEGPQWHPTIAKVCVGRINAISGKPYTESLSKNHQDYVVIPRQWWLDGICSGDGLVKQFVAMPLGQGYTIEAQITDEEKYGGFQIVVMDAADGRFCDRDPAIDQGITESESGGLRAGKLIDIHSDLNAIGIAAGGNIKQQLHKDTHGVESWSPEKKRSLTIHLVNSMAYKAITGIEPPPSPITVAEYQRAKIPWYSHYDETAPVIKPPSIFKRILGITAIERQRGIAQPNDIVQRFIAIQNIHKIRTPDKNEASTTFRKRANESRSKEWWEAAVREISYVIDLGVDVSADDYALRSCCNYHLGRFRDGSIDASLGLRKNRSSIEALTWRAYCRKSLGEYEGLNKDANSLMLIPETELLGIELRAEASLLAGDYMGAMADALRLQERSHNNVRADQILEEVHFAAFGCGRKRSDDV
jgi:hypothetical protein